MKICALCSYPRATGFTAGLSRLFLRGLQAGGATVDQIDLTAVDIRHCLGCYHCWLVEPGRCVHADDMRGIVDRFGAADAAVFISPLNSYSVNSWLKVFMDRTLAFSKEGFVETPRGLIRNSLRDPDRWPRALAIMMVGAFRSIENFSGALTTLELYANGMGMDIRGRLLRPESYLLQFDLAKPKTIKTIEAAFESAGVEFASTGAIAAETEARAATPLSPDLEHFQQYSNVYWEHARALGAEAMDLTKVRDRVTRDVRVLMREMARSIDPAATARLKAVFQFDFTDIDAHYRICVSKGSCTLEERDGDRCDLRVETTSRTWADIFTRVIDARSALMKRLIVLEGDKALFSRLDRYFPPPNA
jgi:putative sterol carrier protein